MWEIRIILLGVLAGFVCVGTYLLRRRKQYERLLESRLVNIALVIVYQSLCYLIVGLPSSTDGNSDRAFLEYPSVRAGFPAIGSLLVCSGVLLQLITVMRRKAIGAQDVKEGLITSGAYRYFRHPIYTGIIWVSLGLPLIMRNPDGLLMFPTVFGINLAQGISEERNDMIVRLGARYEAYRQTTRMLGPIWVWGLLVVFLAIVTLSGFA